MSEVSTVGIDLAKSVFQVHGADASGAVLVRKKLRRDQVLGFFSTLPWTCPDKVESFLPMKGELDEQAEGLYAGV